MKLRQILIVIEKFDTIDKYLIINNQLNMSQKYDLPWIEKYRPKTMDDMIDHMDKINTLRSLITNNELTHLIFYGYAGTGKTSLILACAHEMYGDQMYKYILELNASDDRGIETVRKKIPDFVKASSNKIRLVILDEVDAMTNDAQSALRRVIEKYSKNSRFCLICNNINKIIPGLQSRCTKMRFGYLKPNEIGNKLSDIINREGVKITQPALERLITLNKDFRQILNTLQCMHIVKLQQGVEYPPIQPDEINKYLGIPTNDDLQQIIDMLNNLSFHDSCEKINDLFRNNQWNLVDLVHRLAENVIKNVIYNTKQKYFIIDRLSDIESKLSHSNDAEIQLYALISAFHQSHDIKM